MGKPELVEIAHLIPDIEDEDLMKNVMTDYAGFADKQVKAREEQLMAGVTQTAVQGSTAPAKPQTAQDWANYIESLPDGPKRVKATNEYGDFLATQHNTKI